jgi:transcriptional regulator with XRE-family HTH domain
LIRQQRLMTSLTLNELAALSGVSPSHLGRMERGERFPSARTLKKIAGPLKLNINELFILAGYLPLHSGISEPQPEGNNGHLDPYVAWVLAREPIEVQRAVIGILSVIRNAGRADGLN